MEYGKKTTFKYNEISVFFCGFKAETGHWAVKSSVRKRDTCHRSWVWRIGRNDTATGCDM